MQNTNKPIGSAIRLKVPYFGGQGHVDEIWFAAIEDEAEALRQVLLRSADNEATILRPLAASDLANYEMKVGQVKNIVNYVQG